MEIFLSGNTNENELSFFVVVSYLSKSHGKIQRGFDTEKNLEKSLW